MTRAWYRLLVFTIAPGCVVAALAVVAAPAAKGAAMLLIGQRHQMGLSPAVRPYSRWR
jgi:hypothetical protein